MMFVLWTILAARAAVPWDLGDCVQPGDEAAMDGTDRELRRRFLDLRRGSRALYRRTPRPSGPVRLSADFEPKEAVHVVFPSWPAAYPAFGELVAALLPYGRVVVEVMFDGSLRDLADVFDRYGIDSSRVEVEQTLLSSVWIRDFGGLWVTSESGRHLLDGRYFVDCLYEDAWPTQHGGRWAETVSRTPLPLEGGNLLTDGQGTCFTTTSLPVRSGLSERRAAKLLSTWAGCLQTIALEPLVHDETEHIDVMLSVADSHTLLLSSVDPRVDRVDAEILELAAARLAEVRALDGRPYRIVRVPMAPPRIERDTGWVIARSHVNLLPFNGVVVVPTYAGAGGSTQRALDAIASVFPDRRIVPVRADAYMADGGAVHCATWTVPRAPVVRPVPGRR